MERWEVLWPGGPGFFYDDALFPPGTDAFLLGAFPKLRRGALVCDLGAGTGLVGLLLLAREPSLRLHNVELQAAPLALAEHTAAANGFSVRQHLGDLRTMEDLPETGRFDLVVSNPPYFPEGAGPSCGEETLRLARSEAGCTIWDVCRRAARLLRWGGVFAAVYRPDRLCDLLEAMRTQDLEPKRLRLVQHTASSAPSLVLAEGRRGGKPGLTVDPPLILHREDGGDTEELEEIYFRRRGEREDI